MNAYLVLGFAIHDVETFSEYIQEIPKFIEKHSGRYIVRGEQPTVMEGSWKPTNKSLVFDKPKD